MCKFTEREPQERVRREPRGKPGLSPQKRLVSITTAPPAISCAPLAVLMEREERQRKAEEARIAQQQAEAAAAQAPQVHDRARFP